jgi:hypothetical protein
MELKSGTITLSFIAEETPEGGAAGGRVVITPKMVKLTYTYDYRHAPPQQLVDWMESKCELVATRFVSGSSGEVYPGIVGRYSCEVQRKRNGEGPPKETVTGALRLDQDPTTKAWMLTFVNGPQYALWRLK